ncbi:MAG TPA: butyryl-CoA:acetate CoA-transferase [Clostridia bacterium]|nr:butyryl-CoA:acetate CoA-transferase [Clostridia bacterium]
MSYMDEYRRKLVTPEEAVKVIKPGDWIEYGFCVCAPIELDKALAARKDELKDINIRSGVTVYFPEVMKVDPNGEVFGWNSIHFSGADRKIYKNNAAWYIPIKYSEVPRYVREEWDIDVFMVQTTPMDEHGYFNFSVSVSHHFAAAEKAKIVIVEVNENLPKVHGGYEHAIHISQVDYIVEGNNTPPAQFPAAQPTDVDRAVAKQIVGMLRDGDCIQLGIGGMPNAVGSLIAESDLKDLGCHTEMLVDAYVDMYLAGNLSGLKKNFDRGRMVFTFAGGTKKLYDFMNDNPIVAGYPVNYTNHPAIAERLDNLVSINNVVEVDLFGQVCAESSGWKHISGTGGQLDFVQAAYASKGGRSFLCLSSTYKDKDGNLKSRIVPTLPQGAIATDPRTATHYVVTEHGMANMKGKATWQRAEALIEIAHPDFREELIKEAEKMQIWRRSNKR